MRLNKEQHARFAKHLAKYGGEEFRCPVCRKTEFGVEGAVLALTEFYPNSNDAPFYSGGKNHLPVIFCSCTTCGYSFMVNAVVAGIIPRPEIDEGSTYR